MITAEMRKVLEESIKEEMADHDKYIRLSEQAKTDGSHLACGILMDLACEEQTHANLLQHILEKENGL